MQIPSFLGIHNTNPPRSIPDTALVDAVDINIDDAGSISQRQGFVLSKALSSATSGYSTRNQKAYVVAAGTLSRVLPDLTTIAIAASAATEFTDFGTILFTNDGLRIEDDIASTIKLPLPALPPSLTLVDGDLEPGTYSGLFTYRAASGLESGSSPIASIELTTASGIQVSPGILPADYTANLYLTEANGTVFYNNVGVALDADNILADSFPDNAETIAYHDTRLYVSRSLNNGSSIIWYSAPYLHHLYDFAKRFLIIPGQVLAMASTAQGLLIGTEANIYLYAEGVLNNLAAYGVVPGRAFAHSADGRVFIHSKRGACVAMPFENITAKKASLPPGLHCSTALVEQDGMSHFVAVSDGGGSAYNKR